MCETAAVRYIEDDAQLEAALATLAKGDVYFIDTEFESNDALSQAEEVWDQGRAPWSRICGKTRNDCLIFLTFIAA